MNVQHAKVLVTGATSGIGREVALRLAASGVQLALTGRSPTKLEELNGSLATPAVLAKAGDLTSASFATTFVQEADELLGGFTAVVHAAGIGLIKPTLETTDAEFLRVTNLNIRGTFLIAQAACRVMARDKRGLFLTFPGILGKAVMKNAGAYVASKWAVTGLMKAMAQELQRSGVQIGLFHFGGVDSPFWDSIEMKVDRSKMIPLATAADFVMTALRTPPHLVLNEVTLQPDSHQL